MNPESENPPSRPQPKFERPFVAPCRALSPGAPLRWLRLGWRDFVAARGVSLAYGLAVFALSAAVSVAAWNLGRWVLLITALSGFIFVAPLLAFALYSVSRQLCEGREPSLSHTFRAMRRPASNAMVFALVLLVVFLVWARAGSMVHVFFPMDAHPDWRQVAMFLGIGSAVGSIFALIAFAATAFSLPMLANRDVDVVTAVVSSVNAVLRNKPTMAVWIALIVGLTGLGLATALLGLVVVIPWLAYATWHGYRETLDVGQWPMLTHPDAPGGG